MSETRKCAKCGEVKHWKRFRVRVDRVRVRDEAICSTCRRARRKSVLNRTQKREIKEAAQLLHKQIKAIKSYVNKKTTRDRKYLRDVTNPTTDQQRIAITRANGWINFYCDISQHTINLLQETGTHPPLHKLESDPHLQRLYGVYDTKRAQLLRDFGAI